MKKLKCAQRKKLIKELAWAYFSLYIRIRDNFTCVLCGKTYEQGYIQQAGHVIPRGKHIVAYDTDNVHCQCATCNQAHKYYPQAYYRWYVNKYGHDMFMKLSDPAYLNQVYKIDHDSIMETYRVIILGSIDTQPEHVREKFSKLEKQYRKL